MNKFTKQVAARAAWAFVESLLAFLTVGVPVWQIDWKMALGVSATATLISVCKSILHGMPEAEAENGE